MSKMPYTPHCTATPKCSFCAPLYTDLYPRFGPSKLTLPTPKTYPILFTNTFNLTLTPASLQTFSAIEDMESTIESFIQENSFPEYRDIRVPVYRLLTITDSPGHSHDAETVMKLMKENTKAKEASPSASLGLTLTLLIDFPEKQHIGPEKMGWLFGEFPAVPISSWERRGPEEGEARHASLARLEFWREVLRAEGEGRVVFGPE
jgi:hypothetical protein